MVLYVSVCVSCVRSKLCLGLFCPASILSSDFTLHRTLKGSGQVRCRARNVLLPSLHSLSHIKYSGCADVSTSESFLGDGLGGSHAHIQQEQNTDFPPCQCQGHPTQQRCETNPSLLEKQQLNMWSLTTM